MSEGGDGFDLFSTRRAGVLLHPTCLPGKQGVLGESARRFVDFLADAGMTVWQTLPLGPTHSDLSPYQALSAHAGNPDLIDLTDPIARTPLPEAGFDQFREDNQYWLEPFSQFMAIREQYPAQTWQQWPEGLRDRHPENLEAFCKQAADAILHIEAQQYLFFRQWQSLKHYAHERGVLLFGDIPIFVAHDSADVWANRRCFKLDQEGNPRVVAGVPPDYFSEDGQHWGNPLYDWEFLARDGYDWWLQRLDSQRHLFDLIRIDHFRGFSASWEIPADQPWPKCGHWEPGPGADFLQSCFRRFPDLPLVAENLGIIGPEVETLRHQFHLPGMTVLQFGFDGSDDNPHLLKNHRERDLVYTGTHDNDTTLGWYRSLDDRTRNYINQYFSTDGSDMPWPVIEAAFRSVSSMALVPMQDLMGLDSRARFNTPGTINDNWVWKLDWDQCQEGLAKKIRALLLAAERLPNG
ncbi:4-alpha-glucanotransferase [Marinobacter salinexigens]|uniref:4-alpha-glucanotransferase n=1 Tax=Marinobacter salinexigens TaxID=2919747 RepID=A0A5B0VAC1_9GAMM|nr:4-alpha-glucanotransferase [Marinobacter salinexigens]KAA1171011.1 4-alpha-glucanotransferase [Marinobacter salinexigens]